jgi:hypothetical protein
MRNRAVYASSFLVLSLFIAMPVDAGVLPPPGTYDRNIGGYLNSQCSEEKLSDGRRRFICPNPYVIWDGRRAHSSGVVTLTEHTPQGQVIRSCRSKLKVQCW